MFFFFLLLIFPFPVLRSTEYVNTRLDEISLVPFELLKNSTRGESAYIWKTDRVLEVEKTQIHLSLLSSSRLQQLRDVRELI